MMEYVFSDRIKNVKPSAIREILKIIAQNPSTISFATGSPSAESIPVEEIHEISEGIFRDMPIASLQYNITEGYTPLREITKRRLREKFGVGRDFDEVIITTGGQQGLEITPKVLCNPGDTILMESPTFVSAINAFKSHNVRVVGLEMDDEGILPDKLEAAMDREPNVRLLYLIPNFQNPSGKTMSLARRKAVYSLCQRRGVLILEDNPYGELRFRGEDIPTLKSMDEAGIVIYNGSYSKILSAGMRIGFLCAPGEIMQRLIVAKQVGDCHTNVFFQMVTERFLTQYDVDAHVERIRGIYRDKCQLMLDGIDAGFDKRVACTRPDGGLFLWCTLPEGYDSMQLARLAIEKGVAFVPGCSFMADDTLPCNAFRLNYSTPSTADIQRGVPLLADAIAAFLK